MSCNPSQKRKIRKGSSTEFVFWWQNPKFIYKPISGVSQSAPVQLSCTGHGMNDGQYFCVTGVKGGGQQLNGNPEKIADYHKATLVDADTVEINGVNSADWSAYVSGGHIQYREPLNLTGCTAFGQLRETVDAVFPIMEFSTVDGSIVIDELEGKVTIKFDPSITELVEVENAVFDYRIVFPDLSEKYSAVFQIQFTEGPTHD